MIDKNNDYDFVKNRFDEDGLKTPESLSSENMAKLIKSPVRKKHWFRPVISIAACAALVIGLVPFINKTHDNGQDVSSGELQFFSSYDELGKAIKDMGVESQGAGYGDQLIVSNQAPAASSDSFADSDAVEIEDQNLAMGKADEAAEGLGSGEGHSDTYTQVEGVDEADIVKTDGKCIYFSSYMENQVVIAKASKGKAERIASIGSKDFGDFIEDLYLRDGKLIVIASNERDGKEYTSVTSFDVSDPSEPEKLNAYSQAGDLLSSRMIENDLYLVTNDYIYRYDKKRFMPYVYYNDKEAKLPIGNIGCFPDATYPAYTVIGCMDIASDKANQDSIKTSALLGGSSEIYCNNKNLFVTADISEYNEATGDFNERTSVLKVSIKDGDLKYKKTAIISGCVNNQFSMDERNGYFKIAVTHSKDQTDYNSLFILDEDMKEVGSVKNFAKNEHIEAVRYIKDKAYVITYEQTDPLFIIDLADPTSPVIEGHVKITGFSTLLVPVDSDHLLGLGFSTESTEFGEATDGVKLSLFDIKDPSKPEVADAKEFPGMYSEVQYNHKALLAGPDGDYYAIPFDEEDSNFGIMVFSAGSGKLYGFKKLETSDSVMRCIYIGDYIYGVCSDDSIEGFHMN